MSMMRRQNGFSAITAVVLIVLLGLIGAYMATITGIQSLTATLGAGAERARFAVGSGAEWAVKRAMDDDSCSNVDGQSLNIDAGNGVTFTVDFTCNAVSVTEAPDTYNIFQITAAAYRGGSAGNIGYVSRSVRISAADTN